jgi:hypothetical protein
VTVDTELDVWRREWREETEPFPALKKKIRRQNLRIVGAIVAIAVCLIVSTIEAIRTGNAFVAGLAAGIGFAGIVQGAFSWWARRGAWRPAARTTLAYAELAYKRAIATARTTRFSFRFLVIVVVLFAALAVWHWKTFAAVYGLILVAMVAELFLLDYKRQRAQRGLEESKALFEQTKEFADSGLENLEER